MRGLIFQRKCKFNPGTQALLVLRFVHREQIGSLSLRILPLLSCGTQGSWRSKQAGSGGSLINSSTNWRNYGTDQFRRLSNFKALLDVLHHFPTLAYHFSSNVSSGGFHLSASRNCTWCAKIRRCRLQFMLPISALQAAWSMESAVYNNEGLAHIWLQSYT